jgi:hypothetical protein
MTNNMSHGVAVRRHTFLHLVFGMECGDRAVAVFQKVMPLALLDTVASSVVGALVITGVLRKEWAYFLLQQLLVVR